MPFSGSAENSHSEYLAPGRVCAGCRSFVVIRPGVSAHRALGSCTQLKQDFSPREGIGAKSLRLRSIAPKDVGSPGLCQAGEVPEGAPLPFHSPHHRSGCAASLTRTFLGSVQARCHFIFMRSICRFGSQQRWCHVSWVPLPKTPTDGQEDPSLLALAWRACHKSLSRLVSVASSAKLS